MCCFFFFKQKTAYEMRISDWSSDVCSSDLHRRKGRPFGAGDEARDFRDAKKQDRGIGAAQYDGCQRTSTITKAHPPPGKTALPAEPVPSCQSQPSQPARFLPDACRQRGGQIFARAYQIAGVIEPPEENATAAVRAEAKPQSIFLG